jgi:hypothetical protein
MTWLAGNKCDLCTKPCVMAFMNRFRKVLCRLCESCYAESKLATEYEVWRGDYLETLEGLKTGPSDKEFVIKFD